MGFFDKLFKKNEKTVAAPAAEPKAEPVSTKASIQAEPPKAAEPAPAPAEKKECCCKEEPKAAPAAAPAAATEETVGLQAADLGELLPGAPAGGKIKLAIYWAAACGGCDVSILDTNERILTIGDMADIVMWPIAADGKEKDIEAMEDGEITVSIISGAIRSSENEHMVKLLRKKSKIVVAYGTCACFGGSPALANLVSGADEILDYVYTKTPSSANFQADYHADAPVIPQTSYQAPEGELTIPVLYDVVKTLDQVIDVDYSVPGCPPLQETISHMLKAVADFAYNGVALPPKGTMIGVTTKTLCEECSRKKENARITKIYEPHEVDVKDGVCLMDQGILCLGPATVGGCGGRCTSAGQPCRGCYGPTEDVQELGASMFTAVASLFPVLDEDPTCGEDEIIEIMKEVKDPLGYFYAFTLGKSLIKRAVKEKGGQ
ncbi:MAG: oxidoreductase [Candidatus Methanomethylophilaceae archaeon]|nr:oxidoreductase [Candidatus Methanomethylophilaceae archaeon]